MSKFPQPWISTVSHWQATNRGITSLFNHGREDPLPSEADIVIIGAGLTGSALAYQLTREGGAGEGKRVVVLEAKDVASGANSFLIAGRNGGHIRPASFLPFQSLQTPLKEGGAGVSELEAVKVLEDEEENLRLAIEITEKEGLAEKVHWWTGKSLVVYETTEEAQKAKQIFDEYTEARKKYGYPVQEGMIWEGDSEKAKKVTRCHSAVAYSVSLAGTIHPHKFATALMRLAITSKTSSCSFHSWTPVDTILKDEDGWNIKTDKGTIKAKEVVLCSNAHTKHLFTSKDLPFEDHITPYRGTAALITPPPTYAGANVLPHSLMFSGPYIMDANGAGIVIGVSYSKLSSLELCKKDEALECVDDSIVLEPIKKYLAEFFPSTLDGWGKEAHGEGLTRVWTGIMASSRDKLPWVGPCPDQEGLYASVGFHGHGMSRILCCTRALANQMKDAQHQWDEKLPRSFEITKERFIKASEAPKLMDYPWGKKKVVDPVGMAEDGEVPVKI